jgi:hypothetical protein
MNQLVVAASNKATYIAVILTHVPLRENQRPLKIILQCLTRPHHTDAPLVVSGKSSALQLELETFAGGVIVLRYGIVVM